MAMHHTDFCWFRWFLNCPSGGVPQRLDLLEVSGTQRYVECISNLVKFYTTTYFISYFILFSDFLLYFIHNPPYFSPFIFKCTSNLSEKLIKCTFFMVMLSEEAIAVFYVHGPAACC